MKAGTVATGACLIHCTAGPLLLTLLPSTLSFYFAQWGEIVLLGSAAVLCLVPLLCGYRKHQQTWPFVVFSLGFLIQLIHHNLWLSLLGATCFLGSMMWNRRLCHSCLTCRKE